MVRLFERPSQPQQVKSELARHKPFLDAAMATAAFVAMADGDVRFRKSFRIDEVLETVTSLRAFDLQAAVKLFDAHVNAIRDNPDCGRQHALETVSTGAGHANDDALLLRIAGTVGQVEGRYSEASIERIQEVAGILGQPPPELDVTRPRCIAVGNQKGGTGKSTISMHLAVGLLHLGHRVGCLDLDGDQGTLSHYLANRSAFAAVNGRDIKVPTYRRIKPVDARDRHEAEDREEARLREALASFGSLDYIVLDTPPGGGHLARLGLTHADILITPVNDSFLDIDVLAEIDLKRRVVVNPSAYARMVMKVSNRRVACGRNPVDWVVMRNRMSQLDTRNSRAVTELLEKLAARMGFRIQPGLSERVLFRELFYDGLTLFDLQQETQVADLQPRHLNARREFSELLDVVAVSQGT